MNINCPICLKEFGVRGKIIERGNGRFCSRKCKDEYQKQTFIPEQIKKGKKTIINTGRETILPGIYQLEKSGKFAFNYDRKESQMEFMSLEKIKSYENDNLKVITPSAQANLASVVQEGDTGLSLWKYFLLTALLFLLLEILLIRFYK